MSGNALANYLGTLSTDVSTVNQPAPTYFTPANRLELALAYAVTVAGTWIKDGEVYIPYMDQALMNVFEHLRPVHQYVGYESEDAKLVGYHASNISVDEWRKLFLGSLRAARQVRFCLAKNVEMGFRMPEGAERFAAELATGLKDPKRKKKKKTLHHRDTLLAGIAKKVSAAYGLHLGATKTRLKQSPPPECGAVIAAAAMLGHGVTVNFPRADSICRKPTLPVDLLSENYVLRTVHFKPLPPNRNALAPVPPDEYRADPFREYEVQFRKAAQRIGLSLPI
ncbi:hypothetical protein [uncultured Tateyamaria sp.]|uniref:hypothetical protein n=1 Tax=uncultured Tateyamaria sp. TaxID=455651 RepID=UPI00261DCEC4|nr:hypothetical protein [uncultured Tateyamaria sp.]